MQRRSSFLRAVVLVGLIAGGCAHKPLYYCYDNGQIFVGNPNQRVWNGLGGVQLRFEIPPGADPTTWRPGREVVIHRLASVDQEEQVRKALRSDYNREDYYTNFVSLQEYQRRTQGRK